MRISMSWHWILFATMTIQLEQLTVLTRTRNDGSNLIPLTRDSIEKPLNVEDQASVNFRSNQSSSSF